MIQKGLLYWGVLISLKIFSICPMPLCHPRQFWLWQYKTSDCRFSTLRLLWVCRIIHLFRDSCGFLPFLFCAAKVKLSGIEVGNHVPLDFWKTWTNKKNHFWCHKVAPILRGYLMTHINRATDSRQSSSLFWPRHLCQKSGVKAALTIKFAFKNSVTMGVVLQTPWKGNID